MTAKTQAPDLSDVSFEAAVTELEGLVQKMEQGDLSLEESVETYARGRALATHCKRKLAAAQSRIKELESQDAASGREETL